ncbi:DUF6392 family protein [Photorhabdus heterorhabditis]|uniref:DUF6392 family protein n=1 Tax=Photorhabdus heterorhabditis TaxID=880156 RepID=UPI00228662C6|nr:DUF6392 family protein [Photorhabdus heterorhabditis]
MPYKTKPHRFPSDKMICLYMAREGVFLSFDRKIAFLSRSNWKRRIFVIIFWYFLFL